MAVVTPDLPEIFEEAYERAKQILTENRTKLEALARTLIEQETLEGEGLEKVFSEIEI